MYEIALSVAACLGAGTKVDVAWAVATHGFSDWDKAEALAITPGGGRIGSVLSGSLNEQLAELADRGATGRFVELTVGDSDALIAGLACGGEAKCLIVPADRFPAELWDRLRNREPVALVTTVDGDEATQTKMFTQDTIGDAPDDITALFRRGQSDTRIEGDTIVTVLWPVPKLVIVGGGAIAEAIKANAALLDWHTQTVTEVSDAVGAIVGLAVLDKLVVLSHDDELGGQALKAALQSAVGYIGGLGSRRTQQARADWLAYRGVLDSEQRIHGPAGLDIGANTPAEIAVSIVAEALAVRAGKSAGELRSAATIH